MHSQCLHVKYHSLDKKGCLNGFGHKDPLNAMLEIACTLVLRTQGLHTTRACILGAVGAWRTKNIKNSPLIFLSSVPCIVFVHTCF